MFCPSQDLSVCLGLTSREELISPECSRDKVLSFAKMLYAKIYNYIYIYKYIYKSDMPLFWIVPEFQIYNERSIILRTNGFHYAKYYTTRI